MLFAIYLIFAYRHLNLSPPVVGVIFGLSSVGWLVGALVAGRVARSLGLGPTLALAIVASGLSFLATPLALFGPPVIILTILGFIGSMQAPLYNINQVSLRQAITPDRVQGRMNATVRTIVWGTIPIGSFLGGVLGARIGVVPTMLLGGAISLLAAGWIAAGPVIALKEQPAPVTT